MIQSVLYLISIGILSFFAGRLLPKQWFCYRRTPFTPFRWEKEGKVYERIGIRFWMNRLPDMSKIAKRSMRRKALPAEFGEEDLRYLLDESCMAEVIHVLLMVAGLGTVLLWTGVGGVVLACLYALGNLPFVLIQRYNRPRLARLYDRMQARQTPAQHRVAYSRAYTENEK